jgi:hypothetical protein
MSDVFEFESSKRVSESWVDASGSDGGEKSFN